jgi:hypothetical protein
LSAATWGDIRQTTWSPFVLSCCASRSAPSARCHHRRGGRVRYDRCRALHGVHRPRLGSTIGDRCRRRRSHIYPLVWPQRPAAIPRSRPRGWRGLPNERPSRAAASNRCCRHRGPFSLTSDEATPSTHPGSITIDPRPGVDRVVGQPPASHTGEQICVGASGHQVAGQDSVARGFSSRVRLRTSCVRPASR